MQKKRKEKKLFTYPTHVWHTASFQLNIENMVKANNNRPGCLDASHTDEYSLIEFSLLDSNKTFEKWTAVFWGSSTCGNVPLQFHLPLFSQWPIPELTYNFIVPTGLQHLKTGIRISLPHSFIIIYSFSFPKGLSRLATPKRITDLDKLVQLRGEGWWEQLQVSEARISEVNQRQLSATC